MTWNDFNITGIPTVDWYFNLIIKLLFMYLAIIMIVRTVSDYKKGAIAQVIITAVVGFILLAGIVGFQNTMNIVKGFGDFFKAGQSGGGSGGSGV